jgi:hypothetical protein
VPTAIEIPRQEIDTNDTFDPGGISGIAHPFDQGWIAVEHRTATPKLQATAALIIDQEEQDAIVLGQISDR